MNLDELTTVINGGCHSQHKIDGFISIRWWPDASVLLSAIEETVKWKANIVAIYTHLALYDKFQCTYCYVHIRKQQNNVNIFECFVFLLLILTEITVPDAHMFE